MKKSTILLPAIVIACLFAISVHAQWGQTLADCTRSYGEAKQKKVDGNIVTIAVFEYKKMELTASFELGKVKKLQVKGLGKKPLSSMQIFTVLADHETRKARFQPLHTYTADKTTPNKQHAQQLQDSVRYQTWMRSDGALMAMCNRDEGILVLLSAPKVKAKRK